ncbi:hypothetical protein MMPV_009646 [Pyropia vietnamensis]
MHQVYILSRTALEMGYTDDSRRRTNPSKGVLFLTTQRLVFLPEDAIKAGYESLELPLRGMTREVLHQPIFACNNLTASCAYYEGMPFSGELNFKIVFKNGGIGTFLPNFNRCLGAARQAASAAAGNHAGVGGVSSGGVFPEGNAPDAWVNEWGAGNLQGAMAAVDPSDPSRLYLTQPVVQSAGTEGRGSMPQLVGGARVGGRPPSPRLSVRKGGRGASAGLLPLCALSDPTAWWRIRRAVCMLAQWGMAALEENYGGRGLACGGRGRRQAGHGPLRSGQ